MPWSEISNSSQSFLRVRGIEVALRELVRDCWEVDREGSPWPLRTALRGASWAYGLGHLARLAGYRARLFREGRLPCHVISVGNLTVGGTGKTPTVLVLALAIHQQGVRTAVLSRGYQGGSPSPVTVVSDGETLRVHPPEAADEAYLLARRLPGIPVLTGPDRFRVGQHAVAAFRSECLILDDGFQHLGLARDLNLILLDADHPFGNGHLLPRGPLRESPRCLERADALLLTRARSASPPCLEFLRQRYPRLPVAVSRFEPDGVFQVSDDSPRLVAGHRVYLVSGIARPEDFRTLVRSLGVDVVGEVAFPDHHRYSVEEVRDVERRARAASAEFLLTTEKDTVKIRPHLHDADRWCALRIRFTLLAGQEHWRAWTERAKAVR